MKISKKNLTIGGAITAYLLAPSFVFAQNIVDKMGQAIGGFSALPGKDVAGAEENAFSFVGALINGILSVFGIFFMALIIYGGFIWMNARGNQDEIEKAKGIIRSAIIGFILVMAAFIISVFVTTSLEGLNQ